MSGSTGGSSRTPAPSARRPPKIEESETRSHEVRSTNKKSEKRRLREKMRSMPGAVITTTLLQDATRRRNRGIGILGHG